MEQLKLLLDSADLAQESYDPTINKEVGKTIIDGNFPVLVNKQGNTLFIAFRGTRASLYNPLESIRNMIANCSSSDVLGENTSLAEFPVFNKYLSIEALKLTGHSGYMSELNEYYTLIIDEIELYRGLITDIVVTGHSAGGGLGTLFYYIYNNDNSIDNKIPIKNTISFGAPRVIRDNDANIELYTKSCPDLLRVFNANDLVPYLPLKNKSDYGGSLISGFTHVGTPVPLDTNVKVNNLNSLIIQVIRGNKAVYNQIIKNYSLDELRENEIIGLITSDKYLGVMTESLFTCYQKVGVKQSMTDDVLLTYTQSLLEDTQSLLDYSLKCDLAEPLGITEILKANNIYNSDTSENIGITGMVASLLGFSKINVKSHEMDTYIENLELLERIEIDTGFTKIDTERMEYYIPPVPVEPTVSKIFIDLVAEVLQDLDSGKIQGMIEIDESELPALIEYQKNI
jgi:hypothetical protein